MFTIALLGWDRVHVGRLHVCVRLFKWIRTRRLSIKNFLSWTSRLSIKNSLFLGVGPRRHVFVRLVDPNHPDASKQQIVNKALFLGVRPRP